MRECAFVIDAENDGPWSVVSDCSLALEMMLAMATANVLDEGQRRMVVEAMERLDAVAEELAP
jgi:hypothetical protein